MPSQFFQSVLVLWYKYANFLFLLAKIILPASNFYLQNMAFWLRFRTKNTELHYSKKFPFSASSVFFYFIISVPWQAVIYKKNRGYFPGFLFQRVLFMGRVTKSQSPQCFAINIDLFVNCNFQKLLGRGNAVILKCHIILSPMAFQMIKWLYFSFV